MIEHEYCLENWIAHDWHCEDGTIPTNEVKKFIEHIKEDLAMQLNEDDLCWARIRINKLAGEKLVEE